MKQVFKNLITMFLEITIQNSKHKSNLLQTLIKVLDDRKLTDIKMNLSIQPNQEDLTMNEKINVFSNNELEAKEGFSFLALVSKIKKK